MQVRARDRDAEEHRRLDHAVERQVEHAAPGRRAGPQACDPAVDRVEQSRDREREEREPPAVQPEEGAGPHTAGERSMGEHVGRDPGRPEPAGERVEQRRGRAAWTGEQAVEHGGSGSAQGGRPPGAPSTRAIGHALRRTAWTPEPGLASGHPILRLIPFTYPPPNEGVCHA